MQNLDLDKISIIENVESFCKSCIRNHLINQLVKNSRLRNNNRNKYVYIEKKSKPVKYIDFIQPKIWRLLSVQHQP